MSSEYNAQQKALTRTSLREALAELIAERGSSMLSISDLCRKAGVSRMAFYRNYNTIMDVLADYLEDTKSRIIASFENREDKSWRSLGILFMDLAEQERPVFQALFKDGLSSLLTDFLVGGIKAFNTDLYPRSYENDLETEYAAHFEAGGVIGVLSQWFSRDCADSKEDIIVLILKKVGVPQESERSHP